MWALWACLNEEKKLFSRRRFLVDFLNIMFSSFSFLFLGPYKPFLARRFSYQAPKPKVLLPVLLVNSMQWGTIWLAGSKASPTPPSGKDEIWTKSMLRKFLPRVKEPTHIPEYLYSLEYLCKICSTVRFSLWCWRTRVTLRYCLVSLCQKAKLSEGRIAPF